jgi:hypothetical protein
MLLAILIAAGLASAASAQTWTIETVGQDVDYVDFTIDGTGTLHVIYTDVANPSDPGLVYAFDSGFGWQYQTVPAVPEPSLITLAIDARGDAHIAFVDTSLTVHYGNRTGGTWMIEPLPPSELPFHPSIALDSAGDPHIAYLTYGERIYYAHNVGGVWTVEQVNGSFLDISHSRVAMAIDPSDGLHIGAWEYFDGAAFFTRGASSWTHENFGEWGYQPWVELDDDGHAHFVYYGSGTYYGTNESGSWETEVVEPDAPTEDNDIALDSSGSPAVTYSVTVALRYEPPNFYYDTRTYFAYRAGGGWQREQIELAHDYAGPFYYSLSRVAFDASDIPHVLYRDPATGELRHATRNWPTAVGAGPRSAAFGIESVMPNPFNPSTTVAFRLAKRSLVEVVIYDVRGRRLRMLSERTRAPGIHSDVWDGLDDRGGRVASGVYFVQVRTREHSDVRRMVLLK